MPAIRISLSGIHDGLLPGDAITCTVNGEPHKAEFVRYGASERFVFVRVFGIYEVSSGKLAFAPPMFPGEYSYVAEFVVNRGGRWDSTAQLSANVERGVV